MNALTICNGCDAEEMLPGSPEGYGLTCLRERRQPVTVSPGDLVRVASPQGSAFDGREGEVKAVREGTVYVLLPEVNVFVPLPFAPSELLVVETTVERQDRWAGLP